MVTFKNILRYMRSKNYAINEKPYQLNIVGVRNAQSQPNKFDDSIFVFYKDDKNNWIYFINTMSKNPENTDIQEIECINYNDFK